MKTKLKLAGLLLLMFAFSTAVKAQNTTEKKQIPPSDAPSGYTYDFDKTMALIIDRIVSPKKSNADVQLFLDTPDFPAVPKNKNIDAVYKGLIRAWMEKNPTVIINTLKPRTDIVTQY